MSSSQHHRRESQASSGQSKSAHQKSHSDLDETGEEPTTPRAPRPHAEYHSGSSTERGSASRKKGKKTRPAKREKGKHKDKGKDLNDEASGDDTLSYDDSFEAAASYIVGNASSSVSTPTSSSTSYTNTQAMSSSRSKQSSSSSRKQGSSSGGKGKKSDNWSDVTDPDERRRIQNRIAQRKFREKTRVQKERAQRDQDNQEHAGSSYQVPGPDDLVGDEELSGVPWGGLSMRYVVAKGHESVSHHGSRRASDNVAEDTVYGGSGSVTGAGVMASMGMVSAGSAAGTASLAGAKYGDNTVAYMYGDSTQSYAACNGSISGDSRDTSSRSSSDFAQSSLQDEALYDSPFYYDYEAGES